MVRQSPHHSLEVLEQIAKRAERDGVSLRPGANIVETTRNYRVGLVWALARGVLEAKAVDAAIKRGLDTASRWTIPEATASELRYFQSAIIALELAFEEGRLSGPTVQERFFELFTKNSDLRTAARLIDRLIHEILEPSALTSAVSIGDQDKLSNQMFERLRTCGGNFEEALPEGVAERGAWFQTLIGRSLRTSNEEKLRVISEIRAVQQEQGLDFESAALSLLYEPAIVSKWVLSEKLLRGRVGAAKFRHEKQQERGFLGKRSKQDCIRVLDAIRERLWDGESLGKILEDLSIPHRLYKRLIYYYRALPTSYDERLSILDRIATASAKRESLLQEVLEKEQLPPAVFALWVREAREYREKITSSDRRKVIHYFTRAYPRQKREVLLAEISSDLQAGDTLGDALKRRWIPHDIYEIFKRLANRRRSGAASLKALSTGAAESPKPGGKSALRRVADGAGEDSIPEADVRIGTADWAEMVVMALQSAECDGGKVTQTWRSVTRGVARLEILRALKGLLRRSWNDVPAIDEQILSSICVMRTRGSMLDVNALFGARFVSPDADYKNRIMQRRAELELPLFHPLDAK
jgi:hypothetical protein